MKSARLLAIATALLCQSSLASAGEQVLTAPPPAWVIPAPEIDPATVAPTEGEALLFDEQYRIEGDTTTAYIEGARLVASATELQKSGMLAFDWQPDHGDITFHRLEILRGGETIDLLQDGAKFEVLRRETQLQNRMLNGELTAMRQIEGLRVGDILRFALSITERDQVLKGRMQTAMILLPKPVKLRYGRARMLWPASQPLKVKTMVEGVELTPTLRDDGFNELTVALPIAKLPDLPEDIPARFQPLPVIFASDFADWAEVAAVMAPNFDPRGTIPEGSDLAKKVDALARQSKDPLERMAGALRVVQSDVRYLALSMGTGNYVPQTPIETWDKRYGDCKAKTMLLLAMLDRLGIEAEAVLANSSDGDRVPGLLPAPQAFDHIFVHARVGGESFWLDGTDIGARIADIRNVPRFGHVLPLRPAGSELIELPVRADARLSPDVQLVYDSTVGIHLPTPFKLTVTYAGREAETTYTDIQNGGGEKLEELAESLGKSWADSTTVLKPKVDYDPESTTLSLHVEGIAYPDWTYRDGAYELERQGSLRVAFEPDRSRSAWKPLPALIDSPWTARQKITLRLPSLGADALVEGAEPVSLDFEAVSYSKTFERDGATIVEEIVSRETGAEVPSKDIPTMRKAAADLADKWMRVSMPQSYPASWTEIARVRDSAGVKNIRAVYDKRIADDPKDGWRVSDRAWLDEKLLDWHGAEELYGKAIALEPIADFYVSRAAVRDTLGDLAGSLADARTAFEIDSSNAEARSQLAYALADNGGVDEALDLLDPSPDVGTEDGLDAVLQRIHVLWLGKRFEDAVDVADTALRRRPSSADLLNVRCWAKALGDIDLSGAMADCDRAVSISAETADYLDSRAMVHFRSEDMAAALADLDAALALSPNVSTSLFMRGVVAGRLGRDGKPDLAAARALYPGVDGYFASFGIEP